MIGNIFFGPSPLSQDNHPQFEIKISTKILTKYSNEIGFDASFATSKGFLAIPRNEFWGKMKFRDIVIDEFSLPQLLLVGSVAALLGFTRLRNRKNYLYYKNNIKYNEKNRSQSSL